MTIKQAFYSLLLCAAVAPTLQANNEYLEIIRQQKIQPQITGYDDKVTYLFPVKDHPQVKEIKIEERDTVEFDPFSIGCSVILHHSRVIRAFFISKVELLKLLDEVDLS